MVGSVLVISKRAGFKPAVIPEGALVVNITRDNPVLGNPIILSDHKNNVERARVLGEFKIYFQLEIEKRGALWQVLEDLVEQVRQGRVVVLECWCAPKPCHGDVYKEYIEGRLGLCSALGSTQFSLF